MPQPGIHRRARTGMLTALVLVATMLAAARPAEATLPSTPTITLDRVLRTSPFPGSDVSMRDHEGSAYVPRDGSLWLADDDGRSLHEIDVTTGTLKRRIRGSQLAAVTRLGGGATAGTSRTDDVQAVAYDEARDILYVFSGRCCMAGLLPTAFRLTRQGGTLQLDSFQPLPDRLQVAAAAWNPGDGTLYLGADSSLRSYAYGDNVVGSPFGVPGVSSIYGLDFTDDGRDLLIARPPATITRVDWATRTAVPGWNLDLSAFGVLDARGVEVIADRLWVSDGYDFRPAGDPLTRALFVFGVGGTTTTTTPGTPPPPAAPAGPGKNLVGNGGFERSLRGWDPRGSGTDLDRVRGGRSGSWAARVERNKGRGGLGITDAPSWVRQTSGGTYTASMWARSAQKGTRLQLRLKELSEGAAVGQAVARVRLTRQWQKVTVTLTTRSPGRSKLDYSAVVGRGVRGSSFEVDQLRLTLS